MNPQVSKSRFKARALEIFRHIETTGESVVITDRGKPTLIVKRYAPVPDDPRRRLEGSVLHYDDPFTPIAEDDWEALR